MMPDPDIQSTNPRVMSLHFRGSKSILQRLMILLASSRSDMLIENYNPCADVLEMEAALRKYGYTVQGTDTERSFRFDPLRHADSDHQYEFTASATAFRFWLALLAALPGITSRIKVSQILMSRGIEPLVSALKGLGAELEIRDTVIKISGKHLHGAEVCIPCSHSSHFVSSLLLCAPGYQSPLILRLSPDQVSMPYIRLSADLLKYYGADIYISDQEIIVKPGKLNFSNRIKVDGDASTAAAFVIGAVILRRPLCLMFNPQGGLYQADYQVFEILEKLGTHLEYGRDSISIFPHDLQGGQIDLSDCPDLMPSLSILGLFCATPLTLDGIGRLKHKESDRFAGITKALSMLGAKYEAGNDFLTICPLNQNHSKLETCTLDTQNDHRLAMAFTFLHLVYPQISLSETGSVGKSCPEFYDLIELLLEPQVSNFGVLHTSMPIKGVSIGSS